MKLDRTLVKEIKKLVGVSGTREERFDAMKKIEAARVELSTTEVMRTFHDCLKHHGRAAVAICVASTLYEMCERIDTNYLSWAMAVLELWPNRGKTFISRARIDDGLHPTRIYEYAGDFIRLTSED